MSYPIEDSYPLAPIQRGMLFHTVLSPGAGIDIEQLVVEHHEPLDPEALRAAWEVTTARHPSLRCRFRWSDIDVPLQEVLAAEACPPPWRLEDWRYLATDASERRLADLLLRDRRRGFELSRAPLTRVTLVRLGEHRWVQVWTFHHAILDGRVIPTVIEEVLERYDAGRAGRIFELPTPPRYRDYVEWISRLDLDASLAYWRDRLAGFTAPTPLGFGRPRPPAGRRPSEFGICRRTLPPALSGRVRELADAAEVTVNTVLQAVWATLLGAYSGGDEVLFGATRACRHDTVPRSLEMVGPFLNTVPLRVRIPTTTSFHDWLQELRAHWLELRAHEQAPLARLLEVTEVPAGEPLFESLFFFEAFDLDERLRRDGARWPERRFELVEQPSYPLVVSAWDSATIRLDVKYDAERFEAAAAQRLLGHVMTLLEEATADPHRPPGALPILTEHERRFLVDDLNRAQVPFPAGQRIPDLIAPWVERRSETPAVVFGDQQLSYRELATATSHLAAELRRLGVGPEVTVGLCVERSLATVVGIVAILEAGGAYVPLDPQLPDARLQFMLDDSGAAVLIVDRATAGRLDLADRSLIVMAGTVPVILQTGVVARPAAGSGATDLAYIMYTSGSTGDPKGVEVTHRNVLGFVASFRQVVVDHDHPVGTSVATFAFDTSVWEMFSALCYGGTVHLVRPEHSTDARWFAHYLERHGITICYVVPAVIEGLAVRLRERADRLALRCLITGLEPKTNRVLAALREAVPGLRVVNSYGPTEVTYGATAYEYRGDGDPDAEVPIGFPFPNYEVYVVDRDLRPVPVGIGGELLVGGVGVARGYRARPERTARSFIPHPFLPDAGLRVYRTGDWVRFRPDGALEFLGRRDRQVKLRGYRIELGEVEAALLGLPEVAKAVAMVREDRPGDRRLVAYLEPAAGGALDPTSIRLQLATKLPRFMVPTTVVVLECMPLLPNHKVDPARLPVPAEVAEVATTFDGAPRTDVERRIADVWREVLDVPAVGVRDSFFDLGGHSLHLMTVASRLERSFGLEVPFAELFDATTVEDQASALARWRATVRT